MARSAEDDLSLLKITTSLLVEVLGTLSRREDIDPIYADFHTRLESDFYNLGELLNGLQVQWGADDEAGLAVAKLLEVVEEQLFLAEDTAQLSRFLTHQAAVQRDDSGTKEDESAAEDLPMLRTLVKLTSLPSFSHAVTERVGRLLNALDLEKPAAKTRKALRHLPLKCHQAIEKFVHVQVAVDKAEVQSKTQPWQSAGLFCEGMEQLHEILGGFWPCECPVCHAEAMFSFALPCHTTERALHCSLYFPHQEHYQQAKRWRAGKMQLDRIQSTDRKGRALMRSDRTRHNQLCRRLTSAKGGQFVKISQLSLDIRMSSSADAKLAAAMMRKTEQPTSLEMWLKTCQPYPFSRIGNKERFTLAILLSYAYLHLGGGPWWPYERDENMVWFFNASEETILSTALRPYFACPFSNVPRTKRFKSVFELINKQMPSLPAFGHILFQLIVGKAMHFDELESSMDEYKRNGWFGNQVTGAINICIGDERFKSGTTIRDNPNLRQIFMDEVILPLQVVLNFGFGEDMDGMLRRADNEQAIYNGQPQLPPLEMARTPSPETIFGAIERVDTPAEHLRLWHLHDGDELEAAMTTRDMECAATATRWKYDYIQNVRSMYSAMKGHFSDPHPSNYRPVRIAILDTGALLDPASLSVYDDRLVECRNFQTTWGGESSIRMSHGGDDDGHGTHATDLLLELTEHSECEIYVAKVFGKRSEKQNAKANAETEKAIAKAIDYALSDEWDVDILSMSFGFPEQSDVINTALKRAHGRNKLIFAAASNCAGNDQPSWPARDDKVICIHAATGDGNKYSKNPTPFKHQENFAFLGTCVEGEWLPDDLGQRQRMMKSGTSTAAPIAASVAGCVMDVMRRSQDSYLAYLTRIQAAKQDEKRTYEKRLENLGTPKGIKRIFRLMGNESLVEVRDGYHYVTPWYLLRQPKPGLGSLHIVGKILERLDL